MIEQLKPWLPAYLATGLLCLAALHLTDWYIGRNQIDGLKKILRQIEALGGWKARLKAWLGFASGFVLLPLFWPLLAAAVMFLYIPMMLFKRSEGAAELTADGLPSHATVPPPNRFTSERGRLLAQMSIAQIEESAFIDNPSGGVPALPFGHLHTGWLAFKTQLQDGDELWSFDRTAEAAQRSPSATSKPCITGYALLRAGKTEAEFNCAFD